MSPCLSVTQRRAPFAAKSSLLGLCTRFPPRHIHSSHADHTQAAAPHHCLLRTITTNDTGHKLHHRHTSPTDGRLQLDEPEQLQQQQLERVDDRRDAHACECDVRAREQRLWVHRTARRRSTCTYRPSELFIACSHSAIANGDAGVHCNLARELRDSTVVRLTQSKKPQPQEEHSKASNILLLNTHFTRASYIFKLSNY